MKVESPPFLRLQPTLHFGALVSAVVVHDQMDLLISRKLFFEMIEELHELPAAVAMLTSTDHFSIQNVERGEQSGGAVALVVVRLAFWQAGP